ncbi:MAG: alpha/beta hydrolase [Spirosomataceae bacterium]
MGGYMALAFAEKYPQMLEGFGLFHSAFADDEPKREQREKTLRFIETYSAAAFIRQSGPNMYAEAFANQYPETIKNHLEKYTQLPTEAVITGFKAIMNRPDRVAVLQKATVPVLLIFGKEDKFIPFEKHIGLSEIPQQAHTFVSSKSGHLGMIEDAEGCAGAIRDFMKNL